MPKRTPSQTVGPYLHLGLTQGVFGAPEIFGPAVADAGAPGTHIRIEGRVLDGEGNVLPDALIETWQADGEGRYAHPADGRPPASNSFRGFGRCPTAKDGTFHIATIKPGPRARPERHDAGAAHQRERARARRAQAAVHAHLLRRRSGQRERSDPGAGAGRSSRHADGQARPARRPTCSASTFACRARTRRCSSTLSRVKSCEPASCARRLFALPRPQSRDPARHVRLVDLIAVTEPLRQSRFF